MPSGLLAAAVLGLVRSVAVTVDQRPNIVFLVVESTDGRTWTPGCAAQQIVLPGASRRSSQQIVRLTNPEFELRTFNLLWLLPIAFYVS